MILNILLKFEIMLKLNFFDCLYPLILVNENVIPQYIENLKFI